GPSRAKRRARGPKRWRGWCLVDDGVGAFRRAAPLPQGEATMVQQAPRYGLSLPNRGVLFGATSSDELLEVSEQAEASGAFDSVWVGDSLFAKPRLESLVLLSAIAARTRRVRLGTSCLSTFPPRDPLSLAAPWAALDLLSHGRMILGACVGGRLPREKDEAEFAPL